MNAIVSLKIRQGRILNALTLQDLANSIGVSKQMVSKYEKGDTIPSRKILIRLEKMFHLITSNYYLAKVRAHRRVYLISALH